MLLKEKYPEVVKYLKVSLINFSILTIRRMGISKPPVGIGDGLYFVYTS